MELFIDLFGVAEHPFVRYLPSLIPSLLKPAIEQSFKFRFLYSGSTILARAKRAFLLIYDLLFVEYPIAQLLASNLELSRGISIRYTFVSTIMLLLPSRLKVIDCS